MWAAWESLRILKRYRTPLTMRCGGALCAALPPMAQRLTLLLCSAVLCASSSPSHSRRAHYCSAASTWPPLPTHPTHLTPIYPPYPSLPSTFSRVYIWAHPFVMGPYYAYIAGAGAVQGTNTAFACSLAAVTSLAVCALLNARYAMEDPFDDRHSPDAVHAGKDFAELHRMLGATAEGAPLFDDAVRGRGFARETALLRCCAGGMHRACAAAAWPSV